MLNKRLYIKLNLGIFSSLSKRKTIIIYARFDNIIVFNNSIKSLAEKNLYKTRSFLNHKLKKNI